MARLYLSDEELASMTAQLDRILDYVETLRVVDVSGVEPTTHAVSLSCPLRPDLVGTEFPVEIALRGAPATEDGLFAVPAILNREDRPNRPNG